jgi:hypothetical protein
MAHDSFDDRRKALEEQFFQQHDKELVQKLKDAAEKQHSREEIARLTGISNDQVLNSLAELKVGGAATLVMSLFPIIEVAWADGKRSSASAAGPSMSPRSTLSASPSQT